MNLIYTNQNHIVISIKDVLVSMTKEDKKQFDTAVINGDDNLINLLIRYYFLLLYTREMIYIQRYCGKSLYSNP